MTITRNSCCRMTTNSTNLRKSKARARKQKAMRAFTAIEVLISLTLLAIGTAGVISMERGAVKANLDARRMDVANGIARLWVERLRRDSTRWVYPNAENPNLAPTTVPLLFTGDSTMRPALNGAGAWSRPIAYLGNPVPQSPAFDITGKDITTMSDAFFCTNVRLTWLTPSIAAGSGTSQPPGELIRAEVRVFWPRGLDLAADNDYCSGTPDEALLTGDKYHFVYVTTSIRRNTASW